VGALANADDLALLAPTPRALRDMLTVCDNFAADYSVVFNAKKSKCMLFLPKSHNVHSNCSTADKPEFFVGGAAIEYVEEWPPFGHVFTSDFKDEADMMHKRLL